MHRHAVEYSTYPRGPRSGPGCSVPVRHHLFGPIRPTRRHIAISPHGGLYAMPSLCGSAEVTREWFRLSLLIPSWHAVLSAPCEFDIDNQKFDANNTLRRKTTGSALPTLPQSVPPRRQISCC